MSAILVTGATGLVGLNLVHLLTREGHPVRALCRPSSRGAAHAKKMGAEIVNGDVTDLESLRRALRGSTRVFHVAGQVGSGWQAREMEAINVGGTRNVVQAAREANIEKLVQTSSTAAVATGTLDKPATEDSPYDLGHLKSPYHDTKERAEKLVMEAAKQGLDACSVNPSTVFGPWDVKPSSGTLIQFAARRGIPFYTGGSNNFVNAGDVARGHLAALEKGRRGHRYILGSENLTWKEAITLLNQATGHKPPRFKLNRGVAMAFCYMAAPIARHSRGTAAFMDPATLRGAYAHHCVTSEKAQRELGVKFQPVRVGVEQGYRWFKENGYL